MDIGQLEKLKSLLIAKHLNIAVAESLTSGRLQASLSAVSGASDFFEGGITAYNLKQKTRLLGIDKRHAESVNSISEQVALELAAGACKLFHADIGIGTTGYAEPNPEHNVAEPMAYIALCRCHAGKIQNITSRQISGKGLGRIEMQEYVCDEAIASLMTFIENCKPVE